MPRLRGNLDHCGPSRDGDVSSPSESGANRRAIDDDHHEELQGVRSVGRKRPATQLRNPGAALPIAEYLESRQLLSGGATYATAIPAPLWQPMNTNVFDAQNGPMANLGTNLVSIYQSYATGTAASRLASQFPTVEFDDGLVGMDIKSLGGNFGQFVSTLADLGMQVTASSAGTGIAEGWVPVGGATDDRQLPQTMSGSPIEVPILSSFQGYQGVAYNESETSMSAEAARSQFGLDGTGITVGVLSDSVERVKRRLGRRRTIPATLAPAIPSG